MFLSESIKNTNSINSKEHSTTIFNVKIPQELAVLIYPITSQKKLLSKLICSINFQYVVVFINQIYIKSRDKTMNIHNI